MWICKHSMLSKTEANCVLLFSNVHAYFFFFPHVFEILALFTDDSFKVYLYFFFFVDCIVVIICSFSSWQRIFNDKFCSEQNQKLVFGGRNQLYKNYFTFRDLGTGRKKWGWPYGIPWCGVTWWPLSSHVSQLDSMEVISIIQ